MKRLITILFVCLELNAFSQQVLFPQIKQNLILDMLTVKPSAAYSLRSLSKNYKGPLINVRRSSDNATRDFYATANGNLDVNGILDFVGVGNSGFITKWYDQSGNGRDATQSTAANQPRIAQAPLPSQVIVETNNRKPTLYFIAQSSNLNNTTTPFSTSYSVNAVFSRRVANAGSFDRLINIGGGATDSYGFIGAYNGFLTVLLGNGTSWNDFTATSFALGTSSVPIVFTETIVPGASGLTPYANGTAQTTKNGNTSAVNGINIGGINILNTQAWGGTISEVITFPSALSTSDRQKLEFNQSNYYSITVTQ